MRFNSMTRDNDRKKDNSKYFMYAIVLAFFAWVFLNIIFKVGVVLLKNIIRYWWAVLIALVVILFLRKRGKKK